MQGAAGRINATTSTHTKDEAALLQTSVEIELKHQLGSDRFSLLEAIAYDSYRFQFLTWTGTSYALWSFNRQLITRRSENDPKRPLINWPSVELYYLNAPLDMYLALFAAPDTGTYIQVLNPCTLVPAMEWKSDAESLLTSSLWDPESSQLFMVSLIEGQSVLEIAKFSNEKGRLTVQTVSRMLMFSDSSVQKILHTRTSVLLCQINNTSLVEFNVKDQCRGKTFAVDEYFTTTFCSSDNQKLVTGYATGLVIVWDITDDGKSSKNDDAASVLNCIEIGRETFVSAKVIRIQQAHEAPSYLWITYEGGNVLLVDINSTTSSRISLVGKLRCPLYAPGIGIQTATGSIRKRLKSGSSPPCDAIPIQIHSEMFHKNLLVVMHGECLYIFQTVAPVITTAPLTSSTLCAKAGPASFMMLGSNDSIIQSITVNQSSNAAGMHTKHIPTTTKTNITAMAWSPSTVEIIFGHSDGTVSAQHFETGALRRFDCTIENTECITSLYVDSVGSTFAGTKNGFVIEWRTKQPHEPRRWKAHETAVFKIERLDGVEVATAAAIQGEVKVWYLVEKSAKLLHYLFTMPYRVTLTSFAAAKSTFVACGFADGTLAMQQIPPKESIVLKGHSATVSSVMPIDRTSLISASYDASIVLWNLTWETSTAIATRFINTKTSVLDCFRLPSNLFVVRHESQVVLINSLDDTTNTFIGGQDVIDDFMLSEAVQHLSEVTTTVNVEVESLRIDENSSLIDKVSYFISEKNKKQCLQVQDMKRLYRFIYHCTIPVKRFTAYLVAKHMTSANQKVSPEEACDILNAMVAPIKQQAQTQRLAYQKMRTGTQIVSYNSMGERSVSSVSFDDDKESRIKQKSISVSIRQPLVSTKKTAILSARVPRNLEAYWTPGFCWCKSQLSIAYSDAIPAKCESCQQKNHRIPILKKSTKKHPSYLPSALNGIIHEIYTAAITHYQLDYPSSGIDAEVAGVLSHVLLQFFETRFGVKEVVQNKLLICVSSLSTCARRDEFHKLFLKLLGNEPYLATGVVLVLKVYKWLMRHQYLVDYDHKSTISADAARHCATEVLTYPLVTPTILGQVLDIIDEFSAVSKGDLMSMVLSGWQNAYNTCTTSSKTIFMDLPLYKSLQVLLNDFMSHDKERMGYCGEYSFIHVMKNTAKNLWTLTPDDDYEAITQAVLRRYRDGGGKIGYLDFWALLYVFVHETKQMLPLRELEQFMYEYHFEMDTTIGKHIAFYTQYKCFPLPLESQERVTSDTAMFDLSSTHVSDKSNSTSLSVELPRDIDTPQSGSLRVAKSSLYAPERFSNLRMRRAASTPKDLGVEPVLFTAETKVRKPNNVLSQLDFSSSQLLSTNCVKIDRPHTSCDEFGVVHHQTSEDVMRRPHTVDEKNLFDYKFKEMDIKATTPEVSEGAENVKDSLRTALSSVGSQHIRFPTVEPNRRQLISRERHSAETKLRVLTRTSTAPDKIATLKPVTSSEEAEKLQKFYENHDRRQATVKTHPPQEASKIEIPSLFLSNEEKKPAAIEKKKIGEAPSFPASWRKPSIKKFEFGTAQYSSEVASSELVVEDHNEESSVQEPPTLNVEDKPEPRVLEEPIVEELNDSEEISMLPETVVEANEGVLDDEIEGQTFEDIVGLDHSDVDSVISEAESLHDDGSGSEEAESDEAAVSDSNTSEGEHEETSDEEEEEQDTVEPPQVAPSLLEKKEVETISSESSLQEQIKTVKKSTPLRKWLESSMSPVQCIKFSNPVGVKPQELIRLSRSDKTRHEWNPSLHLSDEHLEDEALESHWQTDYAKYKAEKIAEFRKAEAEKLRNSMKQASKIVDSKNVDPITTEISFTRRKSFKRYFEFREKILFEENKDAESSSSEVDSDGSGDSPDKRKVIIDYSDQLGENNEMRFGDVVRGTLDELGQVQYLNFNVDDCTCIMTIRIECVVGLANFFVCNSDTKPSAENFTWKNPSYVTENYSHGNTSSRLVIYPSDSHTISGKYSIAVYPTEAPVVFELEIASSGASQEESDSIKQVSSLVQKFSNLSHSMAHREEEDIGDPAEIDDDDEELEDSHSDDLDTEQSVVSLEEEEEDDDTFQNLLEKLGNQEYNSEKEKSAEDATRTTTKPKEKVIFAKDREFEFVKSVMDPSLLKKKPKKNGGLKSASNINLTPIAYSLSKK